MENVKIEDNLLKELKVFNRKINTAIVLISLILIIIPTVLIIGIMGLIPNLVTLILFLTFVVSLIFSLRMFNYNKILYKTHIWILDCIINEKPLV